MYSIRVYPLLLLLLSRAGKAVLLFFCVCVGRGVKDEHQAFRRNVQM